MLFRQPVKNQQPKIKDEEYLAHESEPKRLKGYDPPLELKDELFSSRLYLKHRVWRNMEKIRKANARPNNHNYKQSRRFRLQHQPIQS